MSFGELLRQHKESISERWFQAALSVYPEQAVAAFRREQDPFANPIGHHLRAGTRQILEALLDEADEDTLRQHLHQIISIAAVQQFAASQAVGFVFELKRAARDVLGESDRDPDPAAELSELDGLIDRIALAAFDVYTACRERVSELRVHEAQRQVSWAVRKMNTAGNGRGAPPSPDMFAAGGTNEQREGVP